MVICSIRNWEIVWETIMMYHNCFLKERWISEYNFFFFLSWREMKKWSFFLKLFVCERKFSFLLWIAIHCSRHYNMIFFYCCLFVHIENNFLKILPFMNTYHFCFPHWFSLVSTFFFHYYYWMFFYVFIYLFIYLFCIFKNI